MSTWMTQQQQQQQQAQTQSFPADPFSSRKRPLSDVLMSGAGSASVAPLSSNWFIGERMIVLARHHVSISLQIPSIRDMGGNSPFAAVNDIASRFGTELAWALVDSWGFQISEHLVAKEQAESESYLERLVKPVCGQLSAGFMQHRGAIVDKYYGKLMQVCAEWREYYRTRSERAELAEAARHFAQLDREVMVLHLCKKYTDPATRALSLTAEDCARAGISIDDLLRYLPKELSRGTFSFPWKHLYVGDPQLMMQTLRSFVPTRSTDPVSPQNIHFISDMFPLRYRGGYLSFVHGTDDYKTMDVLVDVFQEKARLSAKRQDEAKAPLDYWRDDTFTARVVRESLAKFGSISPEALRETLFLLVKECTQFKPSLVVSVIREFNAKRMLDFSAGWGDRLAGAIAAGVDCYHAFDPNLSLRDGHRKIIETFVPEPERQKNFRIEYIPFEESVLEAGAYDLVFTSPPFFDFEIYTSLPGQSVDSFRTLDAWLTKFLFVALAKGWRALAPRGHIVIHITDVYKTKVCEAMCLFMQWKLPGAEYLGVICSSGKAEKPRPMWVFQKTMASHPERSARARDILMHQFNPLYTQMLAEHYERHFEGHSNSASSSILGQTNPSTKRQRTNEDGQY